ncbi:MAG: arylsulfatase [Bacteroidota bacterium]
MNRFYLWLLVLGGFFVLTSHPLFSQSQPNVVLIITDDQGYGDLGYHGNPLIQTPVLDALAAESIRFTQFYVSPVCAPTRSSLMTGRYSLRTGVRDTYNGGAIMSPAEITLAEMLKAAGYRTGMFGKWHLGDSHPSRPIDQGFEVSLMHNSGGMGQVGDVTTWFEGDRSYFDPVLWKNGKKKAYQGYCSDIFTDEALTFIEKNKDQPFFCYLSFNAPHTPLQLPEKYEAMYADIAPEKALGEGYPVEMSERNKSDARKVYGMVSNIDDNVGRVLKQLEDLNLTRETIFIFLTDNGPQQARFNGGMHGRKGSVYEGGIRVPFFFRYPALFSGQRDISTAAAHYDLFPTLAELCGGRLPRDRVIDGKSLVPLLSGQNVSWEERSMFHYWTRKYPERYRNMALRKGDFKLVAQTNYDAPLGDFELYNLDIDPFEQQNLIKEQAEIGVALKIEMDQLHQALIRSPNLLQAPYISVGHPAENPVILNRNDAGGARGIWSQEEVFGTWRVKVAPGRYSLRFKFVKDIPAGGTLYLETHTLVHTRKVDQATDLVEMKEVVLPAFEGELIPFYRVGNQRIFPFWVEVEKVD